MCECESKYNEINAKLDLIINTVEQTVAGLASNPMLKAFLK